jgi:N-acetylglucosaminyl-diphospho-decaprenol L-rhamnosyltransferase
MSTSVAIVNWNAGNRLRVCVESLLATAPDARAVVVDNASVDGSIESLAQFSDRVGLVCNKVNRGLAAALNQAFAATSTHYVLALNPDVQVMPKAVEILERFLDTHPKAGAVGGYVNEKYLPRQFPTASRLIRENLGLLSRKPSAKSGGSASVDQPAAAALMIRRAAYEEAGGFDEQFFPAWYEDVDFCKRLKIAGWEIYFVPDARFHHEGGYSAEALGKKSFVQAYYHNQLRYTRKHLGPTASLAVRASMIAGMLARIVAQPQNAGAYGSVLWGALGRW